MRYPLLPYSQLVFDMHKSNPEVYVWRFIVRLNTKEVDVHRLRSAIEKAIRNHPVFQMHVDEEGLQQYEPLEDILHGQYHAVEFVDKGAFVDVRIVGNRILGDGRSDVLIIEDVIRAYQGLPLQRDFYFEYLQQIEEEKHSARYQADRDWLEAKYGNIECPVHPNTDAPIYETDVPVEGQLLDDYSNLRETIQKIGEHHLLSLTGFFSLASALAIMDYNGTDEAALTWAYDGRETEQEQRIYGSLHRDVPFRIKVNDERLMAKEELIRETRKQFREGIAHSTYPFTLTKPHSDIWNYALNVLVQPSPQDKLKGIPFDFELIEDNAPHVAYSLLDVEILDDEKLFINYRYSSTHYKPESIQKFAALVRKYALWLLSE